MLTLILNIGLLVMATAIFPPDSKIIHLTTTSFRNSLLPSNSIWFVMFYSPYCGYCLKFAPEYAKASQSLNGVIKVAAVNAVEETEIAHQYGIAGYPTVKIFMKHKSSPEEFHGERTAKALVDVAMSAVQRFVNLQLREEPDDGPRARNYVIKLTDTNLKDMAIASKGVWMVNFYVPWSRTCQQFEPVWTEVATKLKGKVHIGSVDTSQNKGLAEKFSITKYPTIKYFPSGLKGEDFLYEEKRKLDDILEFATKLYMNHLPSPTIHQLINYKSFNDSCKNQQLCVISFLPDLLDCQSKCRRSYIKVFKRVSSIFKEKVWGWLWSEGGVQVDLESAAGIGGFGYPAMVVINMNKMKYSVLRGAFSEDGISEFLHGLAYGGGNVNNLKFEGIILDTNAWDGKNAVLPVEIQEPDNNNDEDLFENSHEMKEKIDGPETVILFKSHECNNNIDLPENSIENYQDIPENIDVVEAETCFNDKYQYSEANEDTLVKYTCSQHKCTSLEQKDIELSGVVKECE
ncbi:protein disulfide-isomerase a6 [Holotrichia oblita]|uniref:Protein disulfide-isomerase a6 n=1 Tax=Holotrichia oblita TaxID=644536 RepID=A0ACB9TVF0_HOLOL|nr:protein disulfide-isomerase a6 [Holotrichia oblita]